MQMKLVAGAALAVLAGCNDPQGTFQLSQDFVARNQYRVAETSVPGQFEVFGRPGASGPRYFCAAGDYAYRRLGARPPARVIVVSPVAPSITGRGNSMIFKVGTAADAPRRTGITVSMRHAGESLGVVEADRLCRSNTGSLFSSSVT